MTDTSENARIVSEVSLKLQDIARIIDQELEAVAPGIAFSLFVWTPGMTSHVSNTKQREDTIQAIEKLIAGWKQGTPDVPAHERQ